MNVLIVNTYDIIGGAARAAYRLHSGLLTNGLQSQMLVMQKYGSDTTVCSDTKRLSKAISRIRPLLDSIPIYLYKDRSTIMFSPAWLPFSGIVEKINLINPDIVHLHWINNGFLRIEDLRRIKAPIVWSLHDMWAFTGGCHYDNLCGRFSDSCGSCPVLASTRANDLSRRVWKRKYEVYKTISNITFVGLSRWLTGCAKTSTLLKNNRVVNIPNPIDTTIFKPTYRQSARRLWNLPTDKYLILYGAIHSTTNSLKGFTELNEALTKLNINNIAYVVFGGDGPMVTDNGRFKTYYLGHIHDNVSLVTLYNAADLLVVPSRQENLSNLIMESMACGTPVVAFNIGGNGDMIDHKLNGYLAEPFDTADLAQGMEWILKSKNYDEICGDATNKVKATFDNTVVIKQYHELYNNIVMKGITT